MTNSYIPKAKRYCFEFDGSTHPNRSTVLQAGQNSNYVSQSLVFMGQLDHLPSSSYKEYVMYLMFSLTPDVGILGTEDYYQPKVEVVMFLKNCQSSAVVIPYMVEYFTSSVRCCNDNGSYITFISSIMLLAKSTIAK